MGIVRGLEGEKILIFAKKGLSERGITWLRIKKTDDGFECKLNDGEYEGVSLCGNFWTLVNFIRMARGIYKLE
jgi:hypothetical protein